MFGGVTNLNLDPKNRIAMPSRYRFELQDNHENQVVITLESAQCLIIYPKEFWGDVRRKVQNLATSAHPIVKSYQRLFLGYAETVEIDKAGRILLPTTLKKLANLNKDIVLVGLGNYFELWDQSSWINETEKALSSSQEELAKLLSGF